MTSSQTHTLPVASYIMPYREH